MLKQQLIGTLALAALASNTLASVSTYTSGISMMGGVTNFADFNGLTNFQSLTNYQEDGFEVSVSRDYFSWNPPGFDGSEMFYAGTGALELVDISLVSGADFNDLDMQVSSGWNLNGLGTMHLWIQVYNNGSMIQEFDIDSQTGDYIGLTGGGFDQVMIGSYVNAATRDLHDASQRNAIAIDNISAGTMVPAPGTLALSGIALLGLRRRRA